uniref:Uncharacterized protein n=1 Tax=Rhizophora mucronata TaxID=61149 RepID=A0A2P2IZP4_RHIMU
MRLPNCEIDAITIPVPQF